MSRLSKIELSPGFLAMLCAYFYFDPAETFFPFCLSVLLHEAGHLLCLRALCAPIYRIRISCCGAVICTDPLPYRRELMAAASGPCMNLALLLLCLRRYPLTALINFGLLTYNLLPLYPLDGGRMLRAALHLLLHDGAAAAAERWIAALCMADLGGCAVYAACVLHLGLWPVVVFALLLVRIAGTVVPKESFSRFAVDKSHPAC